MGDPDFVKFVVWKRDHSETVRAYSSLFESESDHCDPFTGGERVVKGVAVLSASNDNYEFVDSFQNVSDGFQMAQMEWLEATDVQAGAQSVAFRWIPKRR